MLQQPSNFLTGEYYNPRKLRLTKIKINDIFSAKIFHSMKKLYRILFLGGGGGGAFFRGAFFLAPVSNYFVKFSQYIDKVLFHLPLIVTKFLSFSNLLLLINSSCLIRNHKFLELLISPLFKYFFKFDFLPQILDFTLHIKCKTTI